MLLRQLPSSAQKKLLDYSSANSLDLDKDINEYHDKFRHLEETLLRKTLKHLNIEVQGTMKSCDACKMAKARAKGVKKQTDTRSTIPGERMYIDITGPFSLSLGGSKNTGWKLWMMQPG